jgi:type II secretory pathway component PulK
MKISLRRQPAGIALLIVMCAIFVLSILAAALAFSMKVESTLAMRADTNQRLVWLGRSGVELARWVLAQEATTQPFDSLNQIWAGGAGSIGESNSALVGIDLKNYQIGDGSVSVKIVDGERFGNVNAANTPLITAALTLMGVDAGQISVVSDSIQDWVQPGDLPRVAGAKDEYYQGLNPPYNCKEAPVDDMSELLLVKGIWDHPEIYWGGAATNHPGPSFQHHLGFGHAGETPNYPFGLVDLFTPFSTGRININTADRNVLQMLLMTSGMDPDTAGTTADSIVKYRAGPDGVEGDADDTPFQNINQLSAAGVNPAVIGQIGRLADVRSATFRVTITAQIGNYKRDFNAILYRPPRTRNVQVVRFYWNY